MKLSQCKMFLYPYLWKYVNLAIVIIKDKKISEKLSWGTQIIRQTVSAVLSPLQASFSLPHGIFCRSKSRMLSVKVQCYELSLLTRREETSQNPYMEKS